MDANMDGYILSIRNPKRWNKNKNNLDKDLPDIIFENGDQFWVIRNEQSHRIIGPAIIWNDGNKPLYEWYLNNACYQFEEYCRKLNLTAEQVVFLKLKYGE